MRRLAVVFALATAGAPVLAQDVGPALNPGSMVGWAGGAAVHSDLERRSGASAPRARAPMSEKEANARSLCARRYSIRTRLGRDSPQVQRLFMLCRKAGYF